MKKMSGKLEDANAVNLMKYASSSGMVLSQGLVILSFIIEQLLDKTNKIISH